MDAPRPYEKWQARATARAIAKAKAAISELPSGTPISRLSNTEWGWIVVAVVTGWICTRAEQAAAEGLSGDLIARMQALDVELYDEGAIAAILPQLGEMEEIDWSRPLEAWDRDTMVKFIQRALTLAQQAIAARDQEVPVAPGSAMARA